MNPFKAQRHSCCCIWLCMDWNDLRRCCWIGFGPAIERAQPCAYAVAQQRNRNFSEVRGGGFEFSQSFPHKRLCACAVTGLHVVERNGDLNQRLEKISLGVLGFDPDALPGFVRQKELTLAIAGESFGECAGFPIKRHLLIICEGQPCELQTWSGNASRRTA